MADDEPRPDEREAYYVLDGAPVRLDPERGPVGARGERIDCRAWMDRAVLVSRDEYLAVIEQSAASRQPSACNPG